MCGIFGIISKEINNKRLLNKLAKHSEQRGKDSSGIIYLENNQYKVEKVDYRIQKLINKVKPFSSRIVIGHSRLITNGLSDNQPVIGEKVAVFHNGIIVNEAQAWNNINQTRKLNIDSELIATIADEHIKNNNNIEELPTKITSICRGTIACAI